MAALAIRTLHVVAMALVVGGTTWLWYSYRTAAIDSLAPARQFEYVFWAGIGVLVVTGVGNLGALGPPGPTTDWGQILLAKLGIVVAVVVGSALRTLLLVRADERDTAETDSVPPAQRWVVARAYGITTSALLGIVVLAEVLAHG